MPPPLSRRNIIKAAMLVITTGIIFTSLVVPITVPLAQGPLNVGAVAEQDIRSPRTDTYTSQILTEEKRQQASAAVPPVYTPPDASIARRQLERLRASLSYISVIKADPNATQEQKLADLNSMEYVQLIPSTEQDILDLNSSRWDTLQQESISVLEQVMRSTIREEDLPNVRRNLPAIISLSLPEDQAAIVAELASAFIAPNSLYNQEQTDAARQQAAASVQPVQRSYAAGETIVASGKVITAIDMEALSHFQLLGQRVHLEVYISAAVLTLLVIAFLLVYLNKSPALAVNLRAIIVIDFLFLVFLLTARITTPGHTVVPYFFPLAAYSLLVSALFGAQPALISTLPLAILVTYQQPYALELILYYTFGGIFGVLVLGKARRMNSFFWSGVVIALSGAAIVTIFRLPLSTTDWNGMMTLSAASLVNGVATASLTLLLQFFLAQLMGMTTALQLMELSRPDHPLLQFLLRNAPGTYQHSLQVANLAEQAAERIGADALLTRVGALYHDAGKALDPIFYIENQITGSHNPHNDLKPEMSAEMVIRHVERGLVLGRRHHLPKRILDFISEHHGDMLARYQYHKAVEEAGGDESQVDKDKFRYPGPRPQSRETALLMLADSCEAKVRAERPKDEDELRELIRDVINNRMSTGVLSDTGLTLRDLDIISDSFTGTLKGIYHPRIQYPPVDILQPAEPGPSPLGLPTPTDPPTPAHNQDAGTVI